MTLAEVIKRITAMRDEAVDGRDRAIQRCDETLMVIYSARHLALNDALALLEKVTNGTS